MNYYERYPGDYLRDTQHLSLAQHGAYTLLMDTYYATEKPFPAALDAVYRICRAMSKAEQAAVRAVCDEFFPVGDDGLRRNKRIDHEISKAQKRINASRVNGPKGGRPRKPTNNPTGSNPVTQQEPTGLPLGNLPETQSGEASPDPTCHIPSEVGNSPPDSRSSNARDPSPSAAEDHNGLVSKAMEANPALGYVVALRKRGGIWLRLTPENPTILAAVAEGVSLTSIEAMAEAYPDKPPTYVINAARNDRAEPAQPVSGGTHAAGPKPIKGAVAETLAAIQRRRDREAAGTAATPLLEHGAG